MELAYLVMNLNIKICDMFSIDLKSLFRLISQILLLSIVLIQIDYISFQ